MIHSFVDSYVLLGQQLCEREAEAQRNAQESLLLREEVERLQEQLGSERRRAERKGAALRAENDSERGQAEKALHVSVFNCTENKRP